MAKRFIDTGLFDDEWFMDLSHELKLTYIYIITKCDHAGMIRVNRKLFKVQLGFEWSDELIKGLGNRIETVSKDFVFIPKFIEFQYPGFPKSNVRQQQSAINLLSKYGLYERVIKELNNSYEHEPDNGNENGRGETSLPHADINPKIPDRKLDTTPSEVRGKYIYSKFYDDELTKAQDENYQKFIECAYGANDYERELTVFTKLEPLSYEQFKKVWNKKEQVKASLHEVLCAIEDWGNPKKRKTAYGVLNTFLTKR